MESVQTALMAPKRSTVWRRSTSHLRLA